MNTRALICPMGSLRLATEAPAFRLVLGLVAFAAVWLAVMVGATPETLAVLSGLIGFTLAAVAFRFDYLHPAVAFLVPWMAVLLFSGIPISKYARPLDGGTVLFILTTAFVWVIATAGAPIGGSWRSGTSAVAGGSSAETPIPRMRAAVVGAFLVVYLLAAANVAYSGYVPLLSLITTGDSRYGDFGIQSVYGAFLAYANSVACLALYLYLKSASRDRLYLGLFLSIIAIHLCFVTRQNIVTLLVEAFVIRSIVFKRASRATLIVCFVGALAGFSALGNLRTGGDIKDLIGVRPEFAWIPDGFVWLYSYSYFNILNLGNMMTLSGAPFYDGSMWDKLIPSIIRTPDEHASYLQLASMTVSSYMYPVYQDAGNLGVKIDTAFWALITAWQYRSVLMGRRFFNVAVYACLFFCALLSFFVDFWLYLPVIFQVVFFGIFQLLLFRRSFP